MNCEICKTKVESFTDDETVFHFREKEYVCRACLETVYEQWRAKKFDDLAHKMILHVALEESLKLQAHYGELLNMHDET